MNVCLIGLLIHLYDFCLISRVIEKLHKEFVTDSMVRGHQI